MTVLSDVTTGSEWISRALTNSGYHADFSGESLVEIERFLNEHTEAGEPRPGGLLGGADAGKRVFSLGAYLGEVVRRTVGGTWVADEADSNPEVNVRLVLADESSILPVHQIIKRIQSGDAASIVAYGIAVGVPVNDRFRLFDDKGDEFIG